MCFCVGDKSYNGGYVLLVVSSKQCVSSSNVACARLSSHTSINLTERKTMSPNGFKEFITNTALTKSPWYQLSTSLKSQD